MNASFLAALFYIYFSSSQTVGIFENLVVIF